MRLLTVTLLSLALIFVLPGCGTTVETRVVDAGTGGGGGDGTGGAGTDTGTPTTGTTDGNGTTGDTGTGDTGTGTDEGGTETTGTTGPPPLGSKCGVEDNPGKAIGETCTEHAECETGYCYDEALWNEDGVPTNRFCTVACNACTLKSNCTEWGTAPGVAQNVCVGLPSYFINYFTLEFTSLCLPGCKNNGHCAGLTGLDTCGDLAFGKENSYGVWDICQPASFPRLDEDVFKEN